MLPACNGGRLPRPLRLADWADVTVKRVGVTVPEIVRGRYTHDHEGPLVVFLIGMRVNRWWRPDVWLPSFRAMTPMMDELYADPSSGFLGGRTVVGAWGPTVIQYWSSAEQLYAYASDTDARHRPAWAEFNKRIRRHPGVSGIWHETYVVQRAESIYVDMPLTGLARMTGHRPITGRTDRAAARLGQAR